MTEEEFRYSGPKPQSKESAVIMMADSIEAAVRSLDMKNPVTIEEMIRKIVRTKIEDNQLSDSNVTFKVSVAKGEMGKIIGKNGLTAGAIRGVMQAAGVKDKLNVNVEFID